MARKTVGILTMLLGLVSLTPPLSAHHSRAMFDIDTFIGKIGPQSSYPIGGEMET